jgi:Probable zinc-ribbon domain
MTMGKKNREKRKPKQSEDPSRRWVDHKPYGRLPLVRHSDVVNGKTYEWWEFDPAFKPRVPRGAVEGDVAQQVYCHSCHVPKYFYVDEPRRCIQCDERFVFTAREQKYWYETRKFNFHSVPVRCAACRRQRRSEHALREQVATARRAVASTPDDPGAQLALARALVELHERTNTGRMEDAVAAARKAARLWPNAPDLAELEARARARLPRTRAR